MSNRCTEPNEKRSVGRPAPVAKPSEHPVRLDRAAAMELTPEERKQWYGRIQCRHAELTRVTKDLMELMSPTHTDRIAAVVGMTSIGKTALARYIHNSLHKKFWSNAALTDAPVLYVNAPANGERSFSWKTLYQKILLAANEPDIGGKTVRAIPSSEFGRQDTAAALRQAVGKMFAHRHVRVLILDEAVHLLRHDSSDAVMDTLKSLADEGETKLLLLGPYETAPMVRAYGQVVRRSSVVHFRRYKPDSAADRAEFNRILDVLLSLWPSTTVPGLSAISDAVMRGSLGSVGLLKNALMSVLQQQLSASAERYDPEMLQKAFKPRKLLESIEHEATVGEALLAGTTYGDGFFTKDELRAAA